MELHGEVFLFNLSLIAVTFTAVTALVMLLRQTMGGKLSNFDIYLTTSFISFGFAISLVAVIQPMLSLFEITPRAIWGVSSGVAALVFAGVIATNIHRRRVVDKAPMSVAVVTSFSLQVFGVILQLINSFAQPWHGIDLFAAALTLSLAVIMWAFVRRIASLVGDKPGDDWDPKRG